MKQMQRKSNTACDVCRNNVSRFISQLVGGHILRFLFSFAASPVICSCCNMNQLEQWVHVWALSCKYGLKSKTGLLLKYWCKTCQMAHYWSARWEWFSEMLLQLWNCRVMRHNACSSRHFRPWPACRR